MARRQAASRALPLRQMRRVGGQLPLEKMGPVGPPTRMKRSRVVFSQVVHAGDVAQKARPVATQARTRRQVGAATRAYPCFVAAPHDELPARGARNRLGMGRPAFPAEGIAAHAAHGCLLLSSPFETPKGPDRADDARIEAFNAPLLFPTANTPSNEDISRRASPFPQAGRNP